MSEQHPTPWRVGQMAWNQGLRIIDSDNRPVTPEFPEHERGKYDRMVSCVNALAGLNPGAVAELVAWAENASGSCGHRLAEIVSRLRVGRGEDRSEHED